MHQDIVDTSGLRGAVVADEADVLGARLGSGAFEEELAGVDIEPGALVERVDVDRTPAEFAGYLVGHAAEPDVAAGLHSHRPETFEVKGCAPGERIVQQC